MCLQPVLTALCVVLRLRRSCCSRHSHATAQMCPQTTDSTSQNLAGCLPHTSSNFEQVHHVQRPVGARGKCLALAPCCPLPSRTPYPTCHVPESLLLVRVKGHMLLLGPVWEQVCCYLGVVAPADVAAVERFIDGLPTLEVVLQQNLLEPVGRAAAGLLLIIWWRWWLWL
jgi:hypothetical protein